MAPVTKAEIEAAGCSRHDHENPPLTGARQGQL
jgi:hypothetical protein